MEEKNRFIEELEYVCKISPVSGLIGMRAYLENLLNQIILKKEYLSKDECEKEKLGKKINLLEIKNIFTEKELHNIKAINFKGNEAAHYLKGDLNDSLYLYKSLIEIYTVINKLYNHSEEKIKIIKEKRKGKVISYSNNIGYIEDDNTKEQYIFKLQTEHNQNDIKISVGDKLSFNLEENINKKKSNYKAIDIKHIAVIEKIGRTQGHKYAFLKSGERTELIYLDYRNVSTELINKLKRGINISCYIRKGTKKDEAYDISVA